MQQAKGDNLGRARMRFVSMSALVMVLLATLTGASNRMSFVPMEGATGAMREQWPLWRAILVSGSLWIPSALLFLTVTALVRRTPLDQGRWKRSLLIHLGVMLGLAPIFQLLRWGLYLGINGLIAGWGPTREIFDQIPGRSLAASTLLYPIIYLGVAALAYAWEFRIEAMEKERRTVVLERQLAMAQLQMLRMQLSPHFLFNTLNAITSLMRKDADRAEEMMLALTEFLRSTLEASNRPEVPLSEDLELTKRYFGIEAIRFPGRVALELDISPETKEALVPAFLLQPLVENAVRHGLSPRASGGSIRIRSRLDFDHLCLEVEDDGLGSAARPGGGSGHGLGLASARDRLACRFGPRAEFSAGPRPEGGFRVEMRFPARIGEASCVL